MKKKAAVLLVTVSLLLTMFAVPVTANPTDVSLDYVQDRVPEDHWAYQPLANLVAMGIVRGYPAEIDSDGFPWYKISPFQNITRAEFAVMLVQALNLKPDNSAPVKFTDVLEEDWYREAVEMLAVKGIIGGYGDQTFRPKNMITRAEIAAMLVKSLNDQGAEISKTFPDVAEGSWYTQPILRAAHLGIISGYGDGRFKPSARATRAEVMTMIYQFMWNDATGSPEDQNLLDVTDGYIAKQLDVLKARPVDFSPLKPFATGERELLLASEEDAYRKISEIINLNYEKLAPGKVELKSDRLAQVSYRARLTMKMTDPNTKEVTVIYDNKEFTDYYLLMKIGAKWFIYSNFDEGLDDPA